jgi:hypothetical protein
VLSPTLLPDMNGGSATTIELSPPGSLRRSMQLLRVYQAEQADLDRSCGGFSSNILEHLPDSERSLLVEARRL